MPQLLHENVVQANRLYERAGLPPEELERLLCATRDLPG